METSFHPFAKAVRSKFGELAKPGVAFALHRMGKRNVVAQGIEDHSAC